MNNNIVFALRAPYRGIAMVTMLALLAWALGLPAWIHNANAANVSQFSDRITDSDLGANAVHTLRFTTGNAWTTGQDFIIYFDQAGSNFDFTGLVDADLQAGESGFTAVTPGSCGGGTDEVELSVGPGDAISGNVCTGDTVPAGAKVIVVGGTNQINNPATANSYVISLQGTGGTPIPDEGDTRVAIIDDVTVTAAVNTVFTFSINAVGPGVTVNDDVTTTFASSTATTVPFGIIAPNTPKLMAQELRVDTNAYNGFSVTVFADQTLTAGNTATIDEFKDGAATASSTAFTAPTNILGNTDTYGHWGLTSDDNVVSSTTPNLWGSSQALYVGNFINNPVEVFYNNTPVSSTQGGMGVGSTTVAYKVHIRELQEAAKDYTATLTYIATPVF